MCVLSTSAHVSSRSSKPEIIKGHRCDFVLLEDTGLGSKSVSVLIVPFQCLKTIGRARWLLRLESYEHAVGLV